MLEIAFYQSAPTNFFSNPLVGILGTVASIIGLLLAIYFYSKGKQIRKLAYHINPAKAVVVRVGQASRLKVTFNDKTIKSDVTAAQLALWNQGNQSIKPNDVLKPIIIYTENNTPILEASIRKMSRDIIDLKLDEEEYEKGRIGISWIILEQNDGGVVQLIYEGDTNVGIKVDGVIEGQHNIYQLERGASDFERRFNKAFRILGRVYFVTGIVMLVLMCIVLPLKMSARGFIWRDDWIAVVAPVVTTLGGILFLRVFKPAGPPFGY